MQNFMDIAINEARDAALRNEVPVGAVLVKDRQIIARDGNRIMELNDPTAHAEILVIRQAANILKNERLTGCDLYVTLEPCTMCAAAISFARINRLYYGAEDIKGGCVENGARFFDSDSCHHQIEYYGGIQDKVCSDLLKEFFRNKRSVKK